MREFARRKRQFTQIVVGSSQRSRWRSWRAGGRSCSKVEPGLAGGAGIDVHIIARREVPPGADELPGAGELPGVDELPGADEPAAADPRAVTGRLGSNAASGRGRPRP